MLGHLMPIDDGADRQRDLCRSAQRSASAQHGGLDACEIALSGGEQFFTFAAALGGQIGIAADRQALVGESRRRDVQKSCRPCENPVATDSGAALATIESCYAAH